MSYTTNKGTIVFERKGRTFMISKNLQEGWELYERKPGKKKRPNRLDTVFVFSEYRRHKMEV